MQYNQQAYLVVLHVRRRRVELQVTLDNLVHSSQEVLLRSNLPSSTDGEHAGLSRNTPELCTSRVGAESRDELPSNIALDGHALGVNAEDVRTTLYVRERELDLTVDTSGTHQSGIER